MSCLKQNMLKKAPNLVVLVIGYTLSKMNAHICTHIHLYAHTYTYTVKNTVPGSKLNRTAWVMVPV